MKLRAGLFGCGPDGLRSAAALARSGDCELAAIGDTNRRRLDAAASSFGGVVLATGLEELLATGIDFLVHFGPAGARLDAVRLAAEQATPCLLGAPMAPTPDEADRMVRLCEEAEILLGVLVPAMADPLVEALRRMVADDWFGGLTGLRVACARAVPSSVAFPDEAVHLAHWLTARAPVRAERRPAAGDDLRAELLLRGDVRAVLTSDGPAEGPEVAIEGHCGRARLTPRGLTIRGERGFEAEWFAYETPGEELVLARDALAATLEAEAAPLELHGRFARRLDDTDSFPLLGEQAAADLAATDAIRPRGRGPRGYPAPPP